MDIGEAYILGSVYNQRQNDMERMQLIAAHIQQGYDIPTATRIVDQYIAVQQASVGPTLGDRIFNFFFGCFLIWLAACAVIIVGSLILDGLN